MSVKRTLALLLVLPGLVAGLALAAAPAVAQDVLALSSAIALEPGAVVRVPLVLTDAPGTPLGGGNPLQGLAVTVSPSPAAAVTAISFERAGPFAGAVPRFEIETGFPARRTWLISFSNPLPVPAISRIAVLEVSLDPAVPADTLVTLALAAARTGVSNADGSLLETTSAGTLQLVDGLIEVLPASLIFAAGFESGTFSEWPISVP